MFADSPKITAIKSGQPRSPHRALIVPVLFLQFAELPQPPVHFPVPLGRPEVLRELGDTMDERASNEADQQRRSALRTLIEAYANGKGGKRRRDKIACDAVVTTALLCCRCESNLEEER